MEIIEKVAENVLRMFWVFLCYRVSKMIKKELFLFCRVGFYILIFGTTNAYSSRGKHRLADGQPQHI